MRSIRITWSAPGILMRVRVACACNARAMHVGLFDMQRVKCGVSPIGNGGMRHLQPLIADHNSGRVLERSDIAPEGFPSGRFAQQQGGFRRLDERMGRLT